MEEFKPIRVKISSRTTLEPIVEDGKCFYRAGEEVKAWDMSEEMYYRLKVSEDEMLTPRQVLERGVPKLFRMRKPSSDYEGESLHSPNGYIVCSVSQIAKKEGLVKNNDWISSDPEYIICVKFCNFDKDFDG